jgi:sarcosine oxidase, subunit beta
MKVHSRAAVMWGRHTLKPTYDVAIIGAGVHGLAAACYLGKIHGIRKVALLEKGYIGCGNSTRNTAILRSNYRTYPGIAFYDASLRLYEGLARELDWELDFNQSGHFTLAHTDSSITGLRIRAENNQLMGVDSRMVDRDELQRMVPAMDMSERPRFPILAALYHPPGGTIGHDEVVQGYGHACDAMGIEVHQFTAVTGLEVAGRKVVRIRTTKGDLSAGAILNATAGWATTISEMAGVPLPIVSQPLQACVTELIEPFLDYVIVSSNLHVYVSQTAKGELVIGSEVDPYQTYCTRSTLPTLEQMATYTLELFPQLHGLKVLRQWAGVCDMTPDYAPIMGAAGELDNFFMDVGWGTWGFKAGPIAGKCLAETIATGKAATLMEPFAPVRFATGKLVGEKAAAAVSQ